MAKRITELRLERGLTQEEAAKKCGLKYKYYQEYEGKSPRDMRLSTMEKVAKGFDVDIRELL
ncbi:MAG: helix-turn-helix transcriptional regulator [Candidatus Peribacteraceae bacterium]|nr:helix-turn-helix transcriptional regulator [Candidatus Peribacteraceae bacterium]